VIKHIPFNPLFYGGSNAGQPSPIELIPEGYVLEKVVPITDYEWVLVCRGDGPLCHCMAEAKPHLSHTATIKTRPQE